MSAGTGALLGGAVRAFNLADVTVGGNNFHVNGGHIAADAFKFLITVNVTDVESAGGVGVDDGPEAGSNCRLFLARDVHGGVEHQIARDGVKKMGGLGRKNINAENHVPVMLAIVRWEGDGHERATRGGSSRRVVLPLIAATSGP